MLCGIKPVIHKHIYSYYFPNHSISNRSVLAKAGTGFAVSARFPQQPRFPFSLFPARLD